MRKAYTSWVIEGHDPVESLHVTHAYFGRLPEATIAEIKKLLIQDFTESPLYPFLRTFNRPDLFGPNNDIRVLLPASSGGFRQGLFADLKQFALGNYPTYRPHITKTADMTGSFDAFIVDYVLIANKEVIWRATDKR